MANGFLIDPEKHKELFSRAHVAAVTGAAGFTVLFQDANDDDSCDVLVSARGGPGPRISPRLEIQLKATAAPRYNSRDTHLRFNLKQKNYNDLVDKNHLIPRILVVVVVPTLPADWLRLSESSLILFRCCYWRSLADLPETKNRFYTTVAIPKTNLFTVEALTGIMIRIAREEPL
jgi:hypothetical protein